MQGVQQGEKQAPSGLSSTMIMKEGFEDSGLVGWILSLKWIICRAAKSMEGLRQQSY